MALVHLFEQLLLFGLELLHDAGAALVENCLLGCCAESAVPLRHREVALTHHVGNVCLVVFDGCVVAKSRLPEDATVQQSVPLIDFVNDTALVISEGFVPHVLAERAALVELHIAWVVTLGGVFVVRHGLMCVHNTVLYSNALHPVDVEQTVVWRIVKLFVHWGLLVKLAVCDDLISQH